MPDIQITVSPAVMGSSHRVGPDRNHSVIVPLRRQRGSWLPVGAVVEGGHRFARWRRAGMNSRLKRMDWASAESSAESAATVGVAWRTRRRDSGNNAHCRREPILLLDPIVGLGMLLRQGDEMWYRLALTLWWSSICCSSAFIVGGVFLTWRWPMIIWAHIPAVVYGALVEFAGFTCPLTLLENHLRQRAGEAGYRGGFISHYLVKVIYPPGLTHGMQIGLGILLLLVAIIGYWGFLRRQCRISLKEVRATRQSSRQSVPPFCTGARIWADSRVRADEVDKRGGSDGAAVPRCCT